MIKRQQVTPVNYNNEFWKLLNELVDYTWRNHRKGLIDDAIKESQHFCVIFKQIRFCYFHHFQINERNFR
jgi:hypothetical protein